MNPPFPISSEDGDWWAFSPDWTPRMIVSELIHNLADWYLDDITWFDDEDRCRGWFAGIRNLYESIKPAQLRPYDSERDSEFGDPEWWFVCDPGEVGAPALTVRLT